MWNRPAVLFSLICWVCDGFLLASSATASTGGGIAEDQFFKPGTSWKYKYTTRVILNEKGMNPNDIGFMIGSQISVESIWGQSAARVLKITLGLPQVFVRTKGADGFISERTSLESMENAPFYIHWRSGVVEEVLIRKEESATVANLKKGIASLFQFQLLDMEAEEVDASGRCKVLYMTLSTSKIQKAKLSCSNEDLPIISNPELLLSTRIRSGRTADYHISKKNEFLERVTAEEVHEMFPPAQEEIGNRIEVHQTLDFVDTETCDVLKQESYEELRLKLVDEVGPFTEENLLSRREISKKGTTKNFANTIAKYRDDLKVTNLGKVSSARALIPLVLSARESSAEDINKALTAKKNQKIVAQIYDILGYAQTIEAHTAVMKKLHVDQENQMENIERYLWSSSLTAQPNPEIIADLLSKFKKTQNIPKKIHETLLLTISSMAYRLSILPTQKQTKLIGNVQETIINELEAGRGGERVVYLRALRNLRVPGILPKLLDVVKSGTGKEVVLAWKAIRAMEPSSWTKEVKSAAQSTFYQLDKMHDSSSRTLAADVILESSPSEETLKTLLYHLIKEDKQFEVKQYVYQQIKMLSEDDPSFRKLVLRIITSDDRLNNYSALSPKGLSIALRRKFMDSKSSNGSLLTVQEMSSGIVKRGIVNVMMDKDGQSQEIFSLGIFSGGLGGFLGGEESEDDSATAGMELSVLGTGIRPFTFFEGQGELMGHVWSGTASERTTAFQALILLQDHRETLRLCSGFIVDIDMKGAISFDLAGKVEFSLWNRNAQALIEKSVGYVGIGQMRLETQFVNLQVEYQSTIEPQLLLNADIDFSSDVALCLRLSQPESVFRHEIRKIEQIPDTKHTIRRIKKRETRIPGKTYVLNKKNNEMCGNMFK